MNPPIRLLALDMDGTLFGDSLRISDRVCAAVQAAANRGVLISPASGRTAQEGMRVIADLGLKPEQCGPIIADQGAQVYDLERGPIMTRTLDPELAVQIVEYSRAIGVGINVHTTDAVYLERPDPGTVFYDELSNVRPVEVADAVAIIRERQPRILKMAMVQDTLAQTTALVDMINERFGGPVVAARSHTRFCEVTNPLANKGEALRYVANLLGIPMVQVMAIGDNQNDMQMLEYAGIGVAMGHATAEVKAKAKYVTGTLAEDGVASAITRFILERD